MVSYVPRCLDYQICMFDIARGNLEDATVGMFQTESGVSSMGWFGGNLEMIWCASMTRGVSCWNTTTGSRDYFLADMAQVSVRSGFGGGLRGGLFDEWREKSADSLRRPGGSGVPGGRFATGSRDRGVEGTSKRDSEGVGDGGKDDHVRRGCERVRVGSGREGEEDDRRRAQATHEGAVEADISISLE